jgi:hypothetical protein
MFDCTLTLDDEPVVVGGVLVEDLDRVPVSA